IEKNRKQEEYEAQSALKNRIHRLDEEEVEYLKTLAEKQHKVELENEREVAALLSEAKISFSLTISRFFPICLLYTVRPSIPVIIPEPSATRPLPSKSSATNQRSLLANAVKRTSSPHDSFIGGQSKRPNVEVSAFTDETEVDHTVAGNIMTDSSCPTVLDEVFTLNGTDSVGSLPGLANYSSSDSDHSSYSDSESTDVEDAVCTLYDIAASRVRKAKSQSGEEG
ncbi:NEFA-interacting nuclear protein NIP30, partial [Fasciolopsis buskii]